MVVPWETLLSCYIRLYKTHVVQVCCILPSASSAPHLLFSATPPPMRNWIGRADNNEFVGFFTIAGYTRRVQHDAPENEGLPASDLLSRNLVPKLVRVEAVHAPIRCLRLRVHQKRQCGTAGPGSATSCAKL